MAHSMTWNGTALSTYGLVVRLATPAPTLSRTYESKQTQDRAWAGKGQGAPSVFNLPVVIVGTSSSNLLSRVSTVRGLLDQEDECTLAFDMYTDRYWMAKFDSMEGDYTSPTTWEGYIVFTCHDRKAYATSASTQTETLTENISADYGGTVYAIAYDDDYVYIAGATTNAVQQLSKIDLSLVATGPDYGGTIYCLCCDSTNGYIYYGGDGGAGQYDMCKLLTSDMTTIVRGPDYGGIIYACAQYGNYIYYGGNGGAGENDIAKLLKSNMTTIVRSADYGGIIYAMAVNSTDVFIGGATTQTVNSYLISDLSADDTSDGYGATIRGIAVDATNCYWCGELDEVWWAPLTDLTAETQSADLGGDLVSIAVDDDYIYAGSEDTYIYKLPLDLIGTYPLAKTLDHFGIALGLSIDKTNGYLYACVDAAAASKLDTRHFEELAVSGSLGGSSYVAAYGNYVYVASQGDWRIYKLNKSDLSLVKYISTTGKLFPYGIAADADGGYIYVCGAEVAPYTQVWKISMDDLSVVDQCTDYGGDVISVVAPTGDYIYFGGDGGAGQYDIAKCDKATMTTGTRSADYGGVIYGVCVDPTGTWVFAVGATTQRLRRYTTAALAYVDQSDDYGGLIYAVCCDQWLVYFAGAQDTVWAVPYLDLTAEVISADLGLDLYALAADNVGWVYTGGDSGMVYKLDIVALGNFALKDVTTNVLSLNLEGGNLYVAGQFSEVYRLDPRHLWVRSDHEITLTSAGTASSGLDFASTASQANYWMQQYGNQTSGDEFDWEGTQASGEELEVDSELWYCTLEGASAMSGVTGEFLTLSPGANVLYLENVTGVVVFGWTDRFA